MPTPHDMPAQAAHAHQFANARQQELASRLGLWIFLATEVLFFGPLFMGYFYLRLHMPDAVGVASRHTEFWFGTLNTAVLLTASMCAAFAFEARQTGNTSRCAWLLWLTALLGCVFLMLKGIEYHHEFQEHFFPGPGFAPHDVSPDMKQGVRLFFLLYFLATGVHALHLCAGIIVCALFAFALQRRHAHFASVEHVNLGALYWHFVDVIWIFLYPMLYLVERSGG